MYVTAEEAAKMLGVSTGYAYKLIRGLNEELKAEGYRTICGKVPTKYFEKILQYDRSHVGKERFYVSDKGQKDGREKGNTSKTFIRFGF